MTNTNLCNIITVLCPHHIVSIVIRFKHEFKLFFTKHFNPLSNVFSIGEVHIRIIMWEIT